MNIYKKPNKEKTDNTDKKRVVGGSAFPDATVVNDLEVIIPKKNHELYSVV